MMRVLSLFCLGAATAFSQPAVPSKASVSGVVKDSVGGQPLAQYNVSTFVNASWVNDTLFQSPETKQLNSVTDEEGRYKLNDLPPGVYRITVRNAQVPMSSAVTRHIVIASRDLERVDFAIELPGSIAGKVLDENREPVPNVAVRLVSREYYSGTVGYYVKAIAMADDRGVYKFKTVQAGHAYLVMAERDTRRSFIVHSEAPLDPRLRRRVAMPTFYPNSPDRESAAFLTLRPGEAREGINIEVKKSASYCADGTIAGLGGPGDFMVAVEATQPAFAVSSTGGLAGFAGGAKTGPGGKFRVCDLAPGPYRLAGYEDGGPEANRGLLQFDLVDRDVHNLNLTIGQGATLGGEVLWDGAAPEGPSTIRLSLSLTPLMRSSIGMERANARMEIPGSFSIPHLLPSDYALRPFLNAPGLYIKDIAYAGRSILYEPLRLGSAIGNAGLRVVVARDGATLSARVQDKDGNPLPDVKVLVAPASIASEAMLQAALVTGQTDQSGQYKSHSLRPGKYLVLATSDRVEPTTESIDRFWRSRNRFQEVELAPAGSAEIKLTPVSLE